jgi:integrase
MPHTLAELCQTYHREFLSDKSSIIQYWYTCFFGKVLREVGDMPLHLLTPDVLRAWKLSLSQRYKPSTVHRYLSRLSQVLRVAVEEYGWLPAHPMARVRKPSPGRGRTRFLTTDERICLLQACAASKNVMLYPVVVVALNTGGRKNEIRYLRWREVDLQSGVVRFVETKTGHSRSVPLLGEALTQLEALHARCPLGCPWVFPTADGQGPRNVESAWLTARGKAGLDDVHFHDLRHTYASYLAMSGASLKDIADLLGHRSIQETTRYVHLVEGHTRGVVERMWHKFMEQDG